MRRIGSRLVAVVLVLVVVGAGAGADAPWFFRPVSAPVTVELADGLTREGVKPKDNGDLIAAAALGVTPAYVRDLRSEALVLASVEDAIACKALGVDGAYVRGLADAGYRKLAAEEVVGMKAMDVSPEYARAMNRAARGGQ